MDKINTKVSLDNTKDMESILLFIDRQITEKERLEQLDEDAFALEVESFLDQLSEKLFIWHDPLLTEILERLRGFCQHHGR